MSDAVTATMHESCDYEVSDLVFWRGDLCIFDHLGFQSSKPVLHIRGSNGCGKTTLLRSLCFLAHPESGIVSWSRQGEALEPEEARTLISYCGHKDGLNPALTVMENIHWSVSLGTSIDTTTIQDALVANSLDHLRHRPCITLSAGQRRRIALLRASLMQRPVWLWDEPYANLDDEGRAWVDSLIADHVARNGRVIMSAHQSCSLSAEVVAVLELD